MVFKHFFCLVLPRGGEMYFILLLFYSLLFYLDTHFLNTIVLSDIIYFSSSS